MQTCMSMKKLIFCALLAVVEVDTTCSYDMDCTAGWECRDGFCAQCNAGYYSDFETGCMACPGGKYNQDDGSMFCEDCGAGKYTISSGTAYSWNCLACQEGRYAEIASTDCQSCLPGTYAVYEAESCSECAFFQDSDFAAGECYASWWVWVILAAIAVYVVQQTFFAEPPQQPQLPPTIVEPFLPPPTSQPKTQPIQPKPQQTCRTTARARDSHRFGDGLEHPELKSRHFFPNGWMPDKDWTFRGYMIRMGVKQKQIEDICKLVPDKHRILEAAGINVKRNDVENMCGYTAETDMYKKLTADMRSPGKPLAGAAQTYIHFMEKAALPKMPVYHGKVFRGMTSKFAETVYKPNEQICWPAFSSASTSADVAVDFLGKNGTKLTGTLVIIHSHTGRKIDAVSVYPEEKEVLFNCNTFFKVLGWKKSNTEKLVAVPELQGYIIKDLDILELHELT